LGNAIADWYQRMLATRRLSAYAYDKSSPMEEIHRAMSTLKFDENLCNCTALRKASRRISQLYDSALSSSGLKTTQRSILSQLRRSQPTTVGNLAEALVMDSGALAHTLKPLERDRLVSIDIDPKDRRNRLITLTPLGRKRLAASDVLWETAQHAFEQAFGGAKSQAMRDAMRLLVADKFDSTFKQAIAMASEQSI
jgi:DNA-binding MarR family transcriptional regulator